MLAHLRKGETYTDLASGFGIGTTTVYRYLREALDAARRDGTHPRRRRSTSHARKAFVILDGTLLRIDRVGMAGGRDRPYYSGQHKCHGVNVQVLADPAGRLIWVSPALPGARHDMGAAREHGILDALDRRRRAAWWPTPATRARARPCAVPQRRRRLDPDTGRYRRLSDSQKDVNTAHARQRGPGERANAQLKSWKILRKIRSCPTPGHRARQRGSGPHPRQLSKWKGLTGLAPSRSCFDAARRLDPDHGCYRRLSRNQKQVNTCPASRGRPARALTAALQTPRRSARAAAPVGDQAPRQGGTPGDRHARGELLEGLGMR